MAPPCLNHDPAQIWDNYPALNNERNAEVGAIKIFNSALENATNVVADFQNRVREGHQEPFHAASELIEKILRSAILKLGGSGHRGGDGNSPLVPDGQTPVALLPMQVATKPRDHYALPVGLEQILDNGRSREGKDIGIFEEHHPATLVGVTHYNIPSPWAAAHLNAWIQRYGYDPAGNPPPLWKEARDSLCAILWGIFTKRLRVNTVPYKELSRLGRILEGSLHAELFGYDNAKQLLDRIVYASDAENRTVAVNHPICGWFPAPDLLDESHWWRSRGYDLPTQFVLDRPDSLEAGQVQAFLGYLQFLLAKTDQDDSADPAGWYPAIGSLAEELRKRLPQGTQPEPTTAAEDGFFLLDKKEKTVFRVPVQVLSESERELVDRFCVPEVAVVAQGGGFRAPDLPFRSEFLRRNDLSAELQGVRTGADGHPVVVRYRLSLAGRGFFDIERPTRLIEPFLVYTEIWPNFKLPGWQFYFMGSVGDPRFVGNFAFSLFDPNGVRIGAARRSFAQNHEIQGVP
ncbi:MAG: hypothetical protein ACRERU_22605 [Methylococcales bacterium]